MRRGWPSITPSNAEAVMRREEVQQYLAKARAQTADLTTIKRLDVFMETITMARNLSDLSQPAQVEASEANPNAKRVSYLMWGLQAHPTHAISL
jgi:pyruvate kinase